MWLHTFCVLRSVWHRWTFLPNCLAHLSAQVHISHLTLNTYRAFIIHFSYLHSDWVLFLWIKVAVAAVWLHINWSLVCKSELSRFGRHQAIIRHAAMHVTGLVLFLVSHFSAELLFDTLKTAVSLSVWPKYMDIWSQLLLIIFRWWMLCAGR